mgnify:CR=1 FL=1
MLNNCIDLEQKDNLNSGIFSFTANDSIVEFFTFPHNQNASNLINFLLHGNEMNKYLTVVLYANYRIINYSLLLEVLLTDFVRNICVNIAKKF